MRVLVTGVTGFVGRWLSEDLQANGHEVVAPRSYLDVLDAEGVAAVISDARPDVIAHLAAIAFAPDATADPATAYAVAISGTINVLEAARALERPPAILVTGSAEVYGSPHLDDLPLRETARISPRSAYALSKAAQESVTMAYASRFGLRAVVTRSFNHTGPGQRPTFVVPALAERVRSVASGSATEIPVGNLDVRRDVADVRDVVAAYR
ncbi:MAG: GDP-mannose 4,6-dehydratase, partial [Candidatus Limnocylindrales bacterium]